MTSPAEPTSDAALAGVKIVDLSQIGAGPYATSLLGDFGADVIKVEPPEGDQIRYVDELYGHGNSAYFCGLNRSKRGITLDLKTHAGRDALLRLVGDADVVIVTMRPEAARQLGVDHESLSNVNPRLIHCSITAFGEDGPLASMAGMDLLAQARGGIMGITGEPGGHPIKAGPPIADWTASFLACWAITMALLTRERTGEGQGISLNLLDAVVALMPNFTAPFFKSGHPVRPQGGGHPQIVPYQVFEASDGYLVVACLTERFWVRLCEVIGQEFASDPRFATNSRRLEHRDLLVGQLSALFQTRTREAWSEELRRAGVPHSPVNRFEDVFDDEQVVHNGMLLELEDPVRGTIRTVNNPVSMTGTPPRPSRYPPQLGEHTVEVLREVGLSDQQIAAVLAVQRD